MSYASWKIGNRHLTLNFHTTIFPLLSFSVFKIAKFSLNNQLILENQQLPRYHNSILSHWVKNEDGAFHVMSRMSGLFFKIVTRYLLPAEILVCSMQNACTYKNSRRSPILKILRNSILFWHQYFTNRAALDLANYLPPL